MLVTRHTRHPRHSPLATRHSRHLPLATYHVITMHS